MITIEFNMSVSKRLLMLSQMIFGIIEDFYPIDPFGHCWKGFGLAPGGRVVKLQCWVLQGHNPLRKVIWMESDEGIRFEVVIDICEYLSISYWSSIISVNDVVKMTLYRTTEEESELSVDDLNEFGLWTKEEINVVEE